MFEAAAVRSSSIAFLGCCGCMASASPIDWVSMSASVGCVVSHLDWRVEFALSGMWPDLLFVDYGLSLETLQHLCRAFQRRSIACVCLVWGCQLHLLEWGVQLCSPLMLFCTACAPCPRPREALRPPGCCSLAQPFLSLQWNSKILPQHKLVGWKRGSSTLNSHLGAQV